MAVGSVIEKGLGMTLWILDKWGNKCDPHTGHPIPELNGLVEGTAANDLIDANYKGDPQGDRIDANDGVKGSVGNQDVVLAGAGDDTVKAGEANDLVFGGTGNDHIYGGNGDDTLIGGSGSDTIYGDAGCDVIYGGGANGLADNLIVNGSFENVTGLSKTGYGYVGTGGVPSWTAVHNTDKIDIHNDNRGGIKPTDGKNWLDLEATPGNVRVGQTVPGVVTGQPYVLAFDAGDLACGGNGVNIYWGGELVGCINPNDGTMTKFVFNLEGGAGNGNNRLEFEGTGNGTDKMGVSIDNVQLYPAIDSSDTAADVLYGGSGADMIFGHGGNDTLYGGTEADKLFGGSGDDKLYGDDGNDKLFGVKLYRCV